MVIVTLYLCYVWLITFTFGFPMADENTTTALAIENGTPSTDINQSHRLNFNNAFSVSNSSCPCEIHARKFQIHRISWWPIPLLSNFMPAGGKLNIREEKGRTLIPGGSYYEFFVNEASYKFWVVFQLTTVLILLYSAFAAIYFAKYTFLTEVETLNQEDLILRRRMERSFVGLNPMTYQRILDAVQPN